MSERKPLDISIRKKLLANAGKIFGGLEIDLTEEQQEDSARAEENRKDYNAKARDAWHARMQIPENREKYNAHWREYYANMSEEAKEKRREQIREYNKSYRAEHREEEKERKRKYYAAHREEEIAKAIERNRREKQNNA